MSAMTSPTTIERNRPAWKVWVLAGAATAAFAACSTTQKAKLEGAGDCKFLRPIVCASLQPGSKDQAALRYVNPTANWRQYNKVMVMPVTFWGGEKESVSESDRQALANYFYSTLVEHLGKKFEVVDQPGAGTIKLQIAITDAKTAVPVLRTVSMVVPQARALATLKYLATGTYAFVGGAQAEAELTDAMTGQLLAAAMDRRVGGGSITTAAQWQLGDAENAMNKWAEMTTERLASWTSGTATP
jgi:hypothetical protein